MATFIQKLRVAVLGAANDLLDKTIDLNSPSAVRQYVRDLETAEDKITLEAATAAGAVRTAKRERDDTQHAVDAGKVRIAALQGKGFTDAARTEASRVVTLQSLLAGYPARIQTAEETSANIDKALLAIQSKHGQMVEQARRLSQLDLDTKAKRQAANALTAAGKLVGTGASISIDDITTRMSATNDVETERFNRSLGGIDTTEDPLHASAVDDLLTSLTPAKAATGESTTG